MIKKSLTEFPTHNDYVEFTKTSAYTIPNVSICDDKRREVHYNPSNADVKNYYVWLEQEGNVQKGYFTGTNVTETKMCGMTLPLLATFRMGPRWNVSAGPCLSCYFYQTFTGEVFDNDEGIGYLREDTPVGTKIPMTRENPTPYPDNFADSMLPVSLGLEVCFDWKAIKHMNVFGIRIKCQLA